MVQDCIIEPLSGLLYSHFGVNFTNHGLSGTHQYLPDHWSDITRQGLELIRYSAGASVSHRFFLEDLSRFFNDFDIRNKSGLNYLLGTVTSIFNDGSSLEMIQIATKPNRYPITIY